jgi:catalase (peroxidase I)
MKLHSYFQVAAITFALIFANSAPAYCQSPQNNPSPVSQIQQVKDQVQKIGMGEDVTVILFSGVEYYGAISKIEPDSFEIAEVDLKQMVAIAYADVKEIERGYGNMDSSTGKRQRISNQRISNQKISNQKISNRSFWIFLAVGVASTVGFAIWAASKLKKQKTAGPFPRIP